MKALYLAIDTHSFGNGMSSGEIIVFILLLLLLLLLLLFCVWAEGKGGGGGCVQVKGLLLIYMHTQSLHTQNAAHAINIQSEYGLQVKFLQTFELIEHYYAIF